MSVGPPPLTLAEHPERKRGLPLRQPWFVIRAELQEEGSVSGKWERRSPHLRDIGGSEVTFHLPLPLTPSPNQLTSAVRGTAGRGSCLSKEGQGLRPCPSLVILPSPCGVRGDAMSHQAREGRVGVRWNPGAGDLEILESS